MIRIHYLGTCSGTEPKPGMHHTSTMLEADGKLYWFDMGEGCAHTAYTSGIDVTKCRAIFVSHPHIDHIGGMANVTLENDDDIENMEKMLDKFNEDDDVNAVYTNWDN